MMKFIYLDECKDTKYTKIVSLTGVVIDSENYQALRGSFYKTLNCYIEPGQNTINMSPPEIHGSCLLPEISDDEERLRVLRELAEALIRANARVYRAGYHITEQMLQLYKSVDNVLGTCLFGIKAICQPEYANDLLMPVMDSVNKPVFNSFANSIRGLDIMRSTSLPESNISLENTDNLCEMHFADSAQSALMQMTDIVSYLLHAKDFERCGLPKTEFKEKLISISNILVPAIKRNEIVKMQIHT